MSLRRQLIAVSLLLLSLPWAGCQYLREMERTLHTGQEMAVNATATAIAAALRDGEDLIYGTQRSPPMAADTPVLTIATADDPLFTDGFGEDWRNQEHLRPRRDREAGVSLRSAISRGGLHLLLEVDDTDLRYSTPYRRGDRVELICVDRLNARRRHTIAPEGPGLVGPPLGVRGRHEASSLRSVWRERDGGYALEMRLPLDGHCERLALQVFDAAEESDALLFDSRSFTNGKTPWLLFRNDRLEQWLSAFAQPGRRILVRDAAQYTVGVSEGTVGTAVDDSDVFWLLRLLYRSALNGNESDDGERAAGQAPAPVRDSYDGARWLQQQYRVSPIKIIERTATIGEGDAALGTVVVQETTERYLALTDRATGRVLGVSASVLAIAFAGLLFYASLLSWRIRRFSNAARAIAADECSPESFPRSNFRDELGDLSRSYADLLLQISDYNRYLKGLARTLSHELRTPIAVIGSSLENLASDESSPSWQTYVTRAREGLERLTGIVTSMSEASRIEESAQNASFSPVALEPLLQALSEAYGGTFPDHHFACTIRDTPTVDGNGDLIAQLVENAVSFSPEGSTITIDLRASKDGAIIEVSNPGPLLPETMASQMFEPMVSLRDGPRDHSHLGLGLTIARAIARAHGGDLQGHNRDDGTGVLFRLRLARHATAAATA